MWEGRGHYASGEGGRGWRGNKVEEGFDQRGKGAISSRCANSVKSQPAGGLKRAYHPYLLREEEGNQGV